MPVVFSIFPLVTVCMTVSVFVHVTVSPGDAFTGFGVKQLLAVTQAAFAEPPAPFAIVTCSSANADGANAIMPTTRVKTTNSEPISFDFMDPANYCGL